MSAITSHLQVPLGRPYFGLEEEQAVIGVLRSGWVTQGPMVAQFEQEVADRVGAQHAVAVTSATTGLYACLVALGVGPGDEVICPSYTFIATPNSVVLAGATPVFAELDERTWSMDPAAVEAAITPRTAALLPVHMGYAADSRAIHAIAERHGLAVIEDAAPAIGARCADDFAGRLVGDSPSPVVFSFHPRKVITTGEGGMVTTNDSELARRLRLFRHHGMSVSDLARHASGGLVVEQYDGVGHNLRMSDLQAALGVAQMGKLDDVLAQRASVAARYDAAFAGVVSLGRRQLLAGATDSHQAYSLQMRPGARCSRDELMAHLRERGVTTRRGVMSSHLEPAYTHRLGRVDLPVSERTSGTTMMLPIFAGMRDEEVAHVIDSVLEAVAG